MAYLRAIDAWKWFMPVSVSASMTDPVTDLSALPSHFWQNVRPDGYDIRITDANGIELPIVGQSFDLATRTGWVRHNQTITTSGAWRVYYGNAAAAIYRSMIVGDGPSAYWQFENSPADALGGYNGTEGGTVSYAAAKVGNGINANSVGYMTVVGGASLLASAFTLSVWFARGSAANQCLLGATLDSNTGFSAYLTSSGSFRCSLRSGGIYYDKSGTIADNNWHHLAVTWDGISTFAVMLDGVALTGATNVSLINTAGLYIGIRQGLTGPWTGMIDEVAIYPHVLSTDRILAHYNAGIA